MYNKESRELDAYREQLRGYLKYVVDKHHIPGISLDVLANGHRVNVAMGEIAIGVAPMQIDARFDIGRAAKFLTSLAMLELVTERRLDLNTAVGTYLIELKDCDFGKSVLLKHLLADTAGFRYSRPGDLQILQDYSWERLIASIVDAKSLFTPGTIFSQTFESRALLAEIVQRVIEKAAPELVQSKLFDPLGIDHSNSKQVVISHVVDPKTGKAQPMPQFPVGEFWKHSLTDYRLSTGDFMKIIETVLAAREGTQSMPINQFTAQEAQRSITTLPPMSYGSLAEKQPQAVAIGINGVSTDWLGLNGPVFGQSFCFRYHSKHKFAVVLGMNANAPAICDAVIKEVLGSLMFSAEMVTTSAEVDTLNSDELIGTYIGTAGPDVVIRTQGSDLVCELSLQQKVSIPISRDSDHNWIPKSDTGPLSLAVFRDTTGIACLMIGASAYKKVS